MNERTNEQAKNETHTGAALIAITPESLLQTTLQFGVAVDNPAFTTSSVRAVETVVNTCSAAAVLLHSFVNVATCFEFGGPGLELLVV